MAVQETYKLSILEQPGNTAVDVLLYGVIGKDYWSDGDDQNSDENVTKALDSLGKRYKRINLRINSPGGSMLHGNAIIAAIQRNSAEIHAYNDGIAASMAADIFMACKNRHMAKTSMLMVHAPMTSVYSGNAQTMRECADMLDAFADGMIGVMAECCGMKPDEVKSAYYDGKDHWMSYTKCVEMGIVNATEDYEAAAPPEGVEKMSFRDLVKAFQDNENDGQKRPQNWLQKLGAAIWSQEAKKQLPDAPETTETIIIHNTNDDDMTIENVKAALESGALKAEDVAALLPVSAAVPAAPDTAPVKAAAAEETAIDRLTKTVEALAAQVQKISAAPGAGKTFGQFPDSETDADTGTDPLKAMSDELHKSIGFSQRFTH